MKRNAKNADGIFPVVRTTSGPDPSEQKRLFKQIASGWKEAGNLDLLIAQATKTAKMARAESQSELPRKDADELLFNIGQLEKALAADDARDAAFWALHVGATWTRLTVRQFEPKVVHATKVRKGLDKGRTEKATKAAGRRKEILAAITARMKAHPRDSLTYARGIVAEELNLSFDTVRRASVGIKTPRKKMKK